MVSPVFIRPALVILVAAAIICFVIAISRNGSNNSAPVHSAFKQLPQNIDIALRQARFSEMKGGSVLWELVADKVEYDKSRKKAHLTGGIRMDFSGNSSRGAITVTADSGEYMENNKNIKLRGRVRVLTEEGASFETDSLDYVAAFSRFKTLSKVVFNQKRLTLNATGMEMDVKLKQARFNRSVDATLSGSSLYGAK